MTKLLGAAIFVIIVGVILLTPLLLLALIAKAVRLRNPARNAAAPDSYPYEKCPRFLSLAEKSFYEMLTRAIPSTSVVMAKVRLADLIQVSRGTRRYLHYFNRLGMKHVDFVVCTRSTMEPEYCVELDDKSHRREERVKRDHFVDNALFSAGLPLVRFQCKAAYKLEEIKAQLPGGSVPTPIPATDPAPVTGDPLAQPIMQDNPQFAELKATLRGDGSALCGEDSDYKQPPEKSSLQTASDTRLA